VETVTLAVKVEALKSCSA